MAKQQVSQRYILKVHSSRLQRARWKLILSLPEARRNDELIALGDNQVLRWIDEINGTTGCEERIRDVKAQIRAIKRQPPSMQNRRMIASLYEELDQLQFKPDYMHLVIDKDKDLWRACKGFSINGVQYARLLGTSGGVKSSTIVFVSERLAPLLRERIDNGRNRGVPQIPAKLEAYRALTCSGSTPVSTPEGILVVPDCETHFLDDVIMLSNTDGGEPDIQYLKDYEVTLDESDGYGLMLPSLARKWSDDLHLDYMASGMTIRGAWCKGMVFCFDFLEFADKVAGKHIVKDAWGNEVDITKVELILTTSMLKLWACYDSLDHYLRCFEENHYTFAVTKTCPKTLENRRNLNYQFLQGYILSDEQIRELVQPTIDEIKDVISGDYRKTLVFLKGESVTDENAESDSDPMVTALMIDPRMFNDPCIKRKIFHQIESRIERAKTGVIGVHGNYSIICGDPYALCQSIFGIPVTGLLKAGEIYNHYWDESGAKHLACFRAPMSAHNSVRKVTPCRSDEARHWYQHMTACTLLNAWDTITHALNGADKDGDLVMLTDNKILVDNIRNEPAILCAQRKSEKMEVTEDDLIRSNIAGFGDDIGRTTNWITSMFDVQAQFEPDTEEYKVLDYRIQCGQLFQQDCIDKIKGIISKPMPRDWYDWHANRLPDNPTEEDKQRREFNLRMIADKKPYFMRYIYPALMKQYNTYTKNTRVKCMREFRVELEDLLALDESELTDEQRAFLGYYKSRMPVGAHKCVMNRICWTFEHEFDGYLQLHHAEDKFDAEIMKSGGEYTKRQHSAVLKLYQRYKDDLRDYAQKSKRGRPVGKEERKSNADNLKRTFKEECFKVCSNGQQLCDLVIDVCYQRAGTQQFAWDVCGDEIIQNLLERNDYMISYPVKDNNGDVFYAGRRFRMVRRRSACDGYYSEREAVGSECDCE